MIKNRRWLARKSRSRLRCPSLTRSWGRTIKKWLIQTQINQSWTHTWATKKNKILMMTTRLATTEMILSSLCKSLLWWANTQKRLHKLRLDSVLRNVRTRTRTCLVLRWVRFSSMLKMIACIWQTFKNQRFYTRWIILTVSGITQVWAWLIETQVLRSLWIRRMLVKQVLKKYQRRNLSRSILKEVKQTVLV